MLLLYTVHVHITLQKNKAKSTPTQLYLFSVLLFLTYLSKIISIKIPELLMWDQNQL